MEVDILENRFHLSYDVKSELAKGESGFNKMKLLFVDCIQKICPEFIIDDTNRENISKIFNWTIRNKNGALDPQKGLWICGNIGTGKSTIMKAIIKFINQNWRVDYDEKINQRWENVSDYCGKYCLDGYSAFNSLPMGFDEFGTEICPSNHLGNKINVMAHTINVIHDTLWESRPHIITTNCSMKSILESYGPRVVDRIGHIFNIVIFKGGTRRSSSKVWDIINEEEKADKSRLP